MPSTLKQFAIRNLEVQGLAKLVASAVRISSRAGVPTSYQVTCLPAVGSRDMVVLNTDPMDYVLRTAKAAQTLARAGRLNPDTSFILDIGTQSAEVKCRLASAEPTIAMGQLAIQLNLLHPSSVLSAFNTGIYSRIAPVSVLDASDLAEEHKVKVNDGDIVKMIDLTVSKWFKNFELSIVTDSTETQQFYEDVHGVNMILLPQIKSALGIGRDKLIIDHLVTPTNAEYGKIMLAVHNALTSTGTLGAAFFNQDGMRYDFGTVLSCGIPADQCGLLKMDDFVSDDVTTMEVNMASSSMRFGDDAALPVGKVYCDVAGELLKPDTFTSVMRPRISTVSYPEGNAPIGTQVVRVNPPGWLQDAKYASPKDSPASKTAETKLTAWLKTNYRYQTLATSGGTLTAPLMFWPRPGLTYKVVGAETKTELFTGFLASATHDVSVTPGGQGTAKTSLEFTHIRTPGFSLD